MNQNLIRNLVEFGLSEKEAKIYLALLELEIATAKEISIKSGINRSSTYVVIESLQSKGFVGTSDQNGVLKFIASSPDMLETKAAAVVDNSTLTFERIKNIVPELKGLYRNSKEQPKVRVFQGKEGLMRAFEDVLAQNGKVLRVASSPGNLKNILSKDFFIAFVRGLERKNIRTIGIHPDGLLERFLMKIAPKGTNKHVLIPKKKYQIPADIAIYDNKVGYMSKEKGGLAITIESEEITTAVRELFDLAFSKAEQLDNK